MDQQEKKETIKQQNAERQDLEAKENILHFVHSAGWKHAKTFLLERVMEVDSASAIIEQATKNGSLTDIKDKLYYNGIAVNIIADWINTIETQAGVARADFLDDMRKRKQGEFIVRMD